jgi:hypothetical protein
MSESASAAMRANDTATGASSFNPRIIAGLIIAGLVGFLGFWVLSAFAPELSSGRDGGTHAMSRSATGFGALQAVVAAGGRGGALVRSESGNVPNTANARRGGLLVLTPPLGTNRGALDERLTGVSGPVLIIIPKHRTLPQFGSGDKVLSLGYIDAPARMLGNAARGTDRITPPRPTKLASLPGTPELRMVLPQPLQVFMTSDDLEPMITVDGETVLARMAGRRDTYVLSDPDLLNNLAFHDDARARGAYDLITAIAGPDEPIAFDVALNGYGSSDRNLLRSAFVPPFLGFTICLIMGGLFLLWQGFVRFGPPVLANTARAAGKRGLVDTSARLIVQARRARNFGDRYGALVRDTVARRLHAPAQLRGAELDAWLDRFPDQKGQVFTALLSRLNHARTESELVDHASALAQWRRDVLRDNR